MLRFSTMRIRRSLHSISDVQGNQIDESRLLAYVDQSLESLFPSQLLGGEIKLAMGNDVYQQPSVKVSDDMQTKLSQLNEELNKYRGLPKLPIHLEVRQRWLIRQRSSHGFRYLLTVSA